MYGSGLLPWITQSRAAGGDKISSNLVGLPIVSRVYLGYFAVLADQDRDQPVNDLAILLVVSQSEEVGDLAHLLRRSRRELPMREPGIDPANVPLAIAAQHRRLVVLRVNTDAEQLRFAECLRVLLQLLHHLREIVAHPQAVVRKRASRVDEGEQQRLAGELVEVDRLAVLVDQCKVGHFVTGLRDA